MLSATHTTEVWPMTPNVSAPMRRSLSTSWPESAHIRGPEPSARREGRFAHGGAEYDDTRRCPVRRENALAVISMPITASAPAELRLLAQTVERALARQFHGAAKDGISRIPPPYEDQP